MMSNERRRQASIPVMVAKENLKNRQKQKVTLCKQKEQNNQYLPETIYPYNREVGVDYVALEFCPNGWMKK